MIENKNHWVKVVEGFQSAYAVMLENRDTLLSHGGPLHAFVNQETRFIFRATAVYGRLRELALEYRSLRSGLEFGIQLERLSQVGTRFSTRPSFWPLIRAEQEAVTGLDVPHFRTWTDALDVHDASTLLVPDFFAATGLNEVRTLLRNLCPDDLEKQIDLIIGSLFSPAVYLLERRGESNPSTAGPDPTCPTIDHALWIAEELCRSKIKLPDRSLWIAPQADADPVLSQPVPLRDDLYSGMYGLALFFAALARVTGERTFVEEARNALPCVPMRNRSRAHPEPAIGACIGLGGAVYSLTKIGQWLDIPELFLRARRTAAQLSDEIIASDQRFDVFWGTAGTILGLLTLYDETREEWVLARANRCARHLLDHRWAHAPSGHRAWIINGHMRTGFAHGASGIVHSLLRLYQATGDPSLLEAAREAVLFEHVIFTSNHKLEEAHVSNPEHRKSLPAVTWCNGSHGVALSRLAGLGALATPEVLSHIDCGVETALQRPLDDLDHLCCGNMGRTELLLTAGMKLSKPDLVQEANAITRRIVERAKEKGTFRYGISALIPGLFQGAAGIGYQLLRQFDPNLIPSVLLWD